MDGLFSYFKNAKKAGIYVKVAFLKLLTFAHQIWGFLEKNKYAISETPRPHLRTANDINGKLGRELKAKEFLHVIDLSLGEPDFKALTAPLSTQLRSYLDQGIPSTHPLPGFLN